MGEFNIVSLIQRFSGEIAISAVAATVVSISAKKIFKLSAKPLIVISLIFGGLSYALFDRIFLNSEVGILLANIATSGALAFTLTLFFSQLAFSSSEDIKKSLEKLLSSIVLSEQLDEVVDNIIEKLSTSGEATVDNLKQLIKDNVHASLDEEELTNIVTFIINACSLDKKDGE